MPDYVCPKSIYKYLDFDGLNKTLSNQSFKLSRPSDFNDPLDLLIEECFGMNLLEFLEGVKKEFYDLFSNELDQSKLRNNPNKDKLILINNGLKKINNLPEDQAKRIREEIFQTPLEDMYDLEKLKKTNKEALEAVQKSFKNEGIFCSTTDHKNLLMWAHYADQHRGAVIEFTPSIKKDSALLASKPIEYLSVRPLLYRTPKDMVIHGLMMSPKDSIAKIVNSLIYTKGLVWDYEQEYRLSIPNLIPDFKPFATLRFHAEELTSIYLGCRMEDEDKKTILTLARSINPAVEIYKSTLSTRDYDLHYKPIT